MRTGKTEILSNFLDTLRDPEFREFDSPCIGVVVAHPDDETIGCGALLARAKDAHVVVVTDGAPCALSDARERGFQTTSAYAAARSCEFRRAMKVAGIPGDRLIQFGVPDQEAAFRIPKIVGRLAPILTNRGIQILLTHSYEGGHPDHDATAFCAHRAAAHCAHVAVLEMPFYRAAGDGEALQSFPEERDEKGSIEVRLGAALREIRKRMLDCYRTQSSILSGFSRDREKFRIAPEYDFLQPPNGGQLLYERQPWGVTGEIWRRCVRDALAELAKIKCH